MKKKDKSILETIILSVTFLCILGTIASCSAGDESNSSSSSSSSSYVELTMIDCPSSPAEVSVVQGSTREITLTITDADSSSITITTSGAGADFVTIEPSSVTLENNMAPITVSIKTGSPTSTAQEVVIEFDDGDTITEDTICRFTVEVTEDTEAPVITGCPGDITETVELGVTDEATVTWAVPTVTDNSGVEPTLMDRAGQSNSGDTFLVGDPRMITYIFTDTEGNSAACSFTVTVTAVDKIRPTCIPPSNVVVDARPGATSAAASWEEPVATDNSGTANVINQTHTSGQFFDSGETTVTYILKDPSGNSGFCAFTVTVNAVPWEDPSFTDVCANGNGNHSVSESDVLSPGIPIQVGGSAEFVKLAKVDQSDTGELQVLQINGETVGVLVGDDESGYRDINGTAFQFSTASQLNLSELFPSGVNIIISDTSTSSGTVATCKLTFTANP